MSGNAITGVNTALGQVLMSLQYDAANPAFTNTRQQNAYDGTIALKPSDNAVIKYDQRNLAHQLQNYLVIGDVLPPQTSIQMCNVGNFQISTVGMQGDNVNIGQLWTSYTVTLSKYKLPDANEQPFSTVVAVVTDGFTSVAQDAIFPNFKDSGQQIDNRQPQKLSIYEDVQAALVWFDLTKFRPGVYKIDLIATRLTPETGSWANWSQLLIHTIGDLNKYASFFGIDTHPLNYVYAPPSIANSQSMYSFYISVGSGTTFKGLRFERLTFQPNYLPDYVQIDIHPVNQQ